MPGDLRDQRLVLEFPADRSQVVFLAGFDQHALRVIVQAQPEAAVSQRAGLGTLQADDRNSGSVPRPRDRAWR